MDVLVGSGVAGYNRAFETQLNEVLSVRKDKQKVIGEALTDEQVAAFLQARPYDDESVEMHILVRAYRGLRAADFRRFLEMFKAEGFDVNATDRDGRSFLAIVREHAQSEDYIAALEEAGAR